MSKVRVLIESDSIAQSEVAAVFKGEFLHEAERDQIFYRHKLSGDILFSGTDYNTIMDAPACELITLTVQRYCSDEWQDYWQGTFTRYDCKVDADRCELKVAPDPNDKYKCLLDAWNTEQTIYDAGDVVPVKSLAGDYQPGGQCVECRFYGDEGPCASPDPDYCVDEVIVTNSEEGECPGGEPLIVTTNFHRVVGVGTPTTPPAYGSGWTYISGNDWWRCPDGDFELGIGKLAHGRLFNDVLEYMVAQAGCTLTVRSHFFDINATHAAPPSNDAYTFAETYLQDLTLHQKSDVKRPFSSDPSKAKVWVMKLRDLLDDLREMFNVYWDILDDGSLIIEHDSYFTELTGADYSDRRIRSQYDNDNDGAPRKEIFRWSDDATLSLAHRGYPIEYDCGEGEVERRVKLFTNDVLEVNDSANAEFIADKGFVLISCQVVDGEHVIQDFNNSMGWVELHDNLHRHGRYSIEGTMNNTPTTFTTAKRVKKLADFTVPVCCDEGFDPIQTVTVPAGVGRVKQATENIYRDTIKFQLLI